MVAPHHFEIANRSGVVINANEETVLGLAALTPDHRRLSFVDNDATHWTATYVPSVDAIRLSPRFSQDEYIDLPVAALAEFHPH